MTSPPTKPSDIPRIIDDWGRNYAGPGWPNPRLSEHEDSNVWGAINLPGTTSVFTKLGVIYYNKRLDTSNFISTTSKFVISFSEHEITG